MAAWAMLITRMTPKIKVSPAAINAYIPPVRTPRTRLWARRPGLIQGTIGGEPPRQQRLSARHRIKADRPCTRLPVRFRIDRIGVLVRIPFRRDHVHDAALPLLEEVAPLRPSQLIPTDLALD